MQNGIKNGNSGCVTYLLLCVDPWTAVPDWKTTSVPPFTRRGSSNCDTAFSVILMSLPARPDLMQYDFQPELTE